MKLKLSYRETTILTHIFFWIVVWFLFVYFFSYNSNDTRYIIALSSLILPVTISITYFVVYFLIPKYLLSQKYFQFILFSFYTLVASAYIIVHVILISFIFLSESNIFKMPPMSKNIVFILIIMYLFTGIVGFMSLLKRNFITQSKNNELENKILSTQLQLKEQELQYLKMQIHPHFLFNTLNTIYGLALKQSQHTPDVILKLSNLLDYILYQINKPIVSLKEEVLHIKEYIDLERIRFQDTLKVEFRTDEIDEKIKIAPMLLIPFVENAFKHGNLNEGFLWIEVEIVVKNNQLGFSIKNSVYNNTTPDKKGGIGLENIKKRLELNYKDNYQLKNNKRDGWYIVDLRIFNLNIRKDD